MRRRRDTTRRVWRVAPILAAVCLAFAAGGRWVGWPLPIVLGPLVLGLAGLAVYAVASRRGLGVSDAIAARIDSDANLRGELRSATWFASRELEDPWIGLHLDRAAARVHAIDSGSALPGGSRGAGARSHRGAGDRGGRIGLDRARTIRPCFHCPDAAPGARGRSPSGGSRRSPVARAAEAARGVVRRGRKRRRIAGPAGRHRRRAARAARPAQSAQGSGGAEGAGARARSGERSQDEPDRSGF